MILWDRQLTPQQERLSQILAVAVLKDLAFYHDDKEAIQDKTLAKICLECAKLVVLATESEERET